MPQLFAVDRDASRGAAVVVKTVGRDGAKALAPPTANKAAARKDTLIFLSFLLANLWDFPRVMFLPSIVAGVVPSTVAAVGTSSRE